ncbi:MAG: hypothetical protein A2029_05000 [Chloroflexi bacterium RBG_19FT_COMBO_47_9]|nr:MAG: hypothetical protein A2029_05000 [Chloroflexi bacterium RBG_19FT_COMBO_47_9]
MANELVGRNSSQTPDSHRDDFLGNDITHFRESSDLSDSLIKRLIEWLASIKRQISAIRYTSKLN